MGKNIKKIVMLIMVMILGIQGSLPAREAEAAGSEATIIGNTDGTVTVKYNNKSKVKSKVLVIKDNKMYQYDLKNGNNIVRVPLTQGNGTYTVMVCKCITGSKYSPIAQKKVKLKLSPSRKAFKPTHIIINFKNTNPAIKKAKQLVKKCKTKEDKIKAIWNYVVKNYKYDYAKQRNLSSYTSQYVPNVNTTYKSKKGICYDISALYSAMLRSVGIEAQLQTGYCSKVNGYHAWNRVYNSEKKKWYTIDCTYDLCMYRKGGKYSMKKASGEYKTVVYLY
ncbi:MAG: transglutaminase-like domain-containing protein [bacterium]|nr:transglutaminase-like domain-containing protein [bacterium]